MLPKPYSSKDLPKLIPRVDIQNITSGERIKVKDIEFKS